MDMCTLLRQHMEPSASTVAQSHLNRGMVTVKWMNSSVTQLTRLLSSAYFPVVDRDLYFHYRTDLNLSIERCEYCYEVTARFNVREHKSLHQIFQQGAYHLSIGEKDGVGWKDYQIHELNGTVNFDTFNIWVNNAYQKSAENDVTKRDHLREEHEQRLASKGT